MSFLLVNHLICSILAGACSALYLKIALDLRQHKMSKVQKGCHHFKIHLEIVFKDLSTKDFVFYSMCFYHRKSVTEILKELKFLNKSGDLVLNDGKQKILIPKEDILEVRFSQTKISNEVKKKLKCLEKYACKSIKNKKGVKKCFKK